MKRIGLITLVLIIALQSVVSGASLEEAKLIETVTELETLRETENRVTKTLMSQMAEDVMALNKSLQSDIEISEDDINTLIRRVENTLIDVPTEIIEVQSVLNAIGSVRQTLSLGSKANVSDIGNHWGNSYITNLIGKGGISGYPDGTFRPNNTITKAEFVTIAVRSALSGQVGVQSTGHWASGVFDSARENQVLLLNDFPERDWNKPITRYEMAYVLVRITDKIMKEAPSSTQYVERAISDYAEVSKQSNYKYYVEQAFMKGLVTGKTADGLYAGNANGTRAEAATMVVRMLEKNTRVETKIEKALEGTAKAKAELAKIPTYQTKTDHGLIFGTKGYTLEDAALFATDYLSVRTNYDGTNLAAMDKWEQEAKTYVTLGNYAGIQTAKQSIISKKEKASSDVYVDATKIEIQNGAFVVHAVVYEKVANKTWEVEVTIGGHNTNTSNLAVGLSTFTEIK
jgi:hypothetical protein